MLLQTLEISGKIRLLQGQSLKGDAAPLALFALCCPFGPLPLHDVTARDYTFKSKHKMDMSPLSMDPRSLARTVLVCRPKPSLFCLVALIDANHRCKNVQKDLFKTFKKRENVIRITNVCKRCIK